MAHTSPTPLPAARQRGGVMMVMLVILILGITTAFVTSLSGTALQNKRNQTTADALARAKEALIGYAVTYGDTHPTKAHGFLPCPDSDGSAGANAEGSSESCGATNVDVLGRFPWRTLDLPALIDGAGECLWYAVSGNYKSTQSSPPLMNWDTPGQLHVYDSNGNEISPGEIVAVVIAPGAPLNNNSSRTGNSAPTCGGNYTAAAYLENDAPHLIDNGDIAAGKFILPHEHRDANGNITSAVNDQFVFITRRDIWDTIQKRVARQAKRCLDDYAADAANLYHKYPWAAKLDDTTTAPNRSGTQDVRFGRFPDMPSVATAGGGLSGLTPVQISDLRSKIQAVQDALNAYIAGTGYLSTLRNKGDNLKDFARDAPYYQSTTDPARAAGIYADNCTGLSCTATLQNMLTSAFNSLNGGDSTMPGSWDSIPSCQQLVNSAYWSAWRDWVFLQIADGFQPGGAGTCTVGSTCLAISGSGNLNGGSGSYHAVIAVAANAMAGQNRSITGTISNFLEGANKTGKTDLPSTTTFETYRNTDPTYATVNGLALCLDDKNECP